MEREHTRPNRAGQLTAVERRRDEVRALDDEDVRVGGLEDVAVEVHEQRNRVEPLGELVEQAAVAPLVRTEPAGQHRGRERDRLRRRLGRERLGVDLDATGSRAASPGVGRHHAQPLQRRGRRRCGHARAGPPAGSPPYSALHAARQPREVRAHVDRHAAAHEDRLEHSERRVRAGRPRRPARARARLGVTRGSSTIRAPAAAITGRAFTKHSSSSLSATESATIPPPAPIQIRSPRELERPDRHVQLQSGDRARVADRARVRLAPAGLQLGDHAHRLDLGRAGHRAGREAGAEQVGVARVVAERAASRSRRGATRPARAAAR